VTANQLKKYAHYLATGEKMLYFTGLANTYMIRKFAIRFLFPGIPVIIVVMIASLLVKFNLVISLLMGYTGAGMLALIMNFFEAKGTQYILTSRRLLMQRGYFNVSLTSASYDKITHVEVKQGFIERSFYRYGKVIIHTAGSKNKELVLQNIAHPIHFKNLLEALIDDTDHDDTPKWKQSTRRNIRKLLS